MSLDLLRIATRNSLLARWQAEHVAARLREWHPGLRVELVGMTTHGDRILDTPLAKVGGKGLFVKELEQGLLDGRADLAVHSMKDVPVDLPPGLCLPILLARADPRDAFVSHRYAHPDQLPPGSRVGTSSLRRQCQLLARYPDLHISDLRGNVDSRLAKLDAGQYDAIILAAAGLHRLGLGERITACLEPEFSLPAIGQGAIGLECRADDSDVLALIQPLNDATTHTCVRAERALNGRLQGGCRVPIAGYAVLEQDGQSVWLRGLVADPVGRQVLQAEQRGPSVAAESVGHALAEALLQQGAATLLAAVYGDDRSPDPPV